MLKYTCTLLLLAATVYSSSSCKSASSKNTTDSTAREAIDLGIDTTNAGPIQIEKLLPIRPNQTPTGTTWRRIN
jgi:hypothetical protein